MARFGPGLSLWGNVIFLWWCGRLLWGCGQSSGQSGIQCGHSAVRSQKHEARTTRPRPAKTIRIAAVHYVSPFAWVGVGLGLGWVGLGWLVFFCFVCSFVRLFVCSFVCLFVCLFVCSFVSFVFFFCSSSEIDGRCPCDYGQLFFTPSHFLRFFLPDTKGKIFKRIKVLHA